MKETEIQRAICDYLALKRYFFWRNNTTPIFDQTRGTFRAMPKYSMTGVSDIILIRAGKPWFLEVKRPNGKPSDNQVEFASRARAAGAEYHVVHSIDDVQALGL